MMGRNRPLRIAMLGHKQVPSRAGGVEVAVTELAGRMALRGHSVTCFNRRNRERAGSGEAKPAYAVRTVWTVDRRGLAALTAALSASVLAALGPFDVVHYHAEGPALFCWLPKLFGKRVAVTVHGLDHRREKWGRVAARLILAGERAAVRHADALIVLTDGAAGYFADRYSRETAVIPNGACACPRRPAALIRDAWALEPDGYILFVGRLVPEKGLEDLLAAWRRVSAPLRLVIAGESSDTDTFARSLRKAAEGDSRVVFTGFVEGDALDELYSNARAYVLPSKLEGMPLTLLEAMGHGCCCLVSDIPECVETADGAVLTFPCGDVAALAEVLQALCDDPELAADWRARAEASMRTQPDWDEVTDRTLALYGRCMKP